jgi:hypothetical protein
MILNIMQKGGGGYIKAVRTGQLEGRVLQVANAEIYFGRKSTAANRMAKRRKSAGAHRRFS